MAMLITRLNPFTGKTQSMEIAVTEQQLQNWHNGELIQNAMPDITADEREFIMTGMLPEQWNEMFGVMDK